MGAPDAGAPLAPAAGTDVDRATAAAELDAVGAPNAAIMRGDSRHDKPSLVKFTAEQMSRTGAACLDYIARLEDLIDAGTVASRFTEDYHAASSSDIDAKRLLILIS